MSAYRRAEERSRDPKTTQSESKIQKCTNKTHGMWHNRFFTRPFLTDNQLPEERRMDPDSTMASEPTLSTLATLASEAEASSSARQEQFIYPSASTSTLSGKTKEQMRKYYLKALHKVVDDSDIVILVLDARDPEGCRSRLVEEEVRRRESEGKKLVFVLNKIGTLVAIIN